MTTKKPQSVGGRVTAKILRRQAFDRYYSDPVICKHCGKIVLIPEGGKARETRRKKYCDQSCAASCNNVKRERVKKPKPSKPPRKKPLEGITKGGLFSTRPNWQSARSAIQKNARKIYKESGRSRNCKICSYSLHTQIAHIIPVSAFPDTTLISKINCIDNLVALCPNHHWEFDHGHLDF